MNINNKQIIFAREYRGYSQTELASKIVGLSQSNLSKYEKGVGTLSSEVLNRIINFLEFPAAFFEKRISNVVVNTHYRSKKCTTKQERSQIDFSNKLIGYIIDQMGESVVFPEMSLRTIDLEDGFTPEEAAQYTRRFLGLRDEPVRNICSLIEGCGVIIVEQDCDTDSFDGVSFVTDAGYYVIIVNRNASNDRKRFTLAHELGHIIMHTSKQVVIPNYRDVEEEAHQFAAEFLMPADEIANSLRGLKLQYLGELKRHWLTSMASIIHRARKLDCINSERYKYLNIEFSRKGYKKNEPIDVYIDTPTVFRQAHTLHKEELAYSDEELGVAFSLPIDVLNRFCRPSSNLKLKMYSKQIESL